MLLHQSGETGYVEGSCCVPVVGLFLPINIVVRRLTIQSGVRVWSTKMSSITKTVRDQYAAVAKSGLSNDSAAVRSVANAFGYTGADLNVSHRPVPVAAFRRNQSLPAAVRLQPRLPPREAPFITVWNRCCVNSMQMPMRRVYESTRPKTLIT